MAFSAQLFLANMKRHDGPAKSSRFQVILPIPTYVGSFISMSLLQQLLDLGGAIQDITSNFVNSLLGGGDSNEGYSDPAITRYLSMQCESAELPGVNLITADSKIYGPTYKVPYQKQFTDVNFSFICTNDFYERKLFDKWIECIMPPDTNNLRFAKGNNTRYLSDITIMQFDDFIKQIYAIKLIDAYPISIASMPLSWGDDNFHRVTVSFAYHYHKVIYEGKYDIGQAVGSALGSVFSDFTRQFQQAIFT